MSKIVPSPAHRAPLCSRPLLALLAVAGALLVSSAAAQERVAGVLSHVWGDGRPGSGDPPRHAFLLTTDDGRQLRLSLRDSQIAAAGGFDGLDGRRVEVLLGDVTEPHTHLTGERVTEQLRTLSTRSLAPRGVSGSVPWVTLPCKFKDVSATPKPQSYFQDQYGTDPGELGHFWQQSSFQQINLTGSVAQNWKTLPKNRSVYVPSGQQADLTALFQDCVDLHDSSVNFADKTGINMMFNDDLDGFAWGGRRWATIDGVQKSWPATWNPPWAYRNQSGLMHEMGHGFGLPHSTNWDDDDYPYDSPWDIMSWGKSSRDPTYGELGTDTIAYHKDKLGWLAPSEIVEVTAGSQIVSLDPLGAPSAGHDRMVRIPIPGGATYYTVEAREAAGLYESGLPADAVLIHEVDSNRAEDAWLFDADVPPADFADNAGSMWLPGETFYDATNEITVQVLSQNRSGGFDVLVGVGPLNEIFLDGFESGNLTAWSSSAP